MLDTSSGKLYNRKRERLSIEKELKGAVEQLVTLFPNAWLDCEGLERRHEIGRGTLILLDICEFTPYDKRREQVSIVPQLALSELPKTGAIYSAPSAMKLDLHTMLDFNKKVGAVFYEGAVAKKVSSIYRQERSEKETHDWSKHRFIKPL
jgi:hypothetical protein